MVHAPGPSRFPRESLRLLILVLLAPAIVVVSAATLLGLLGIFVAWLIVVGVLVAAIVLSDLARRSARALARPPVGATRQAVGYPGR